MERGAGGGHHQYVAAGHPNVTSDEHKIQSSFDNPATKKKPPKLKSIDRSVSMAIDNYAPQGIVGGTSPPHMLFDDSMIIEHRSLSPVPIRSAPPPQTLALPAHHQHQMHGGGSGAVSPALSARQQHLSFQHLATQARQRQHAHPHSSSTSSPTSHVVSPVQPDIYLVSSSLGDDVGAIGGSTSPIQFIDDYMLPPSHRHTATATHPLKKSMFRRSDTIDVHPASSYQIKKTHSFHAQQDPSGMDHLIVGPNSQGSSAASSRRTSSVRGNFLMPSHPSKDTSRSPSPSRRGCRSHRSFNDPSRRPSIKPESVVESQIRHPSLNDELMESLDGRPPLFAPTNLSLENELFIESRSRSNSHTKMENVGADMPAQRGAAMIRKSSGSFEDGTSHSATHPPASSTSIKKRDHPHSRQHSSHSLELDGRPSTSAAAAAAAAATHAHPSRTIQLHSAAAAATAAYHFKRGAQHGRSLYLSPSNLEELQIHRPGVLAAAAAFQGTNASAKQAKALHSASVRLRTYRETLSATKKSKSFIGDGTYPPPISGNDFELTSPHRRNSRPLSSAVPGASIEDIKRSPRPMAIASTSTAAAFIEEKRPSFERKPSLTYEIGDAAFEQVLRPFHHKVAGRKSSLTGTRKALKKKSLSEETDEDEEADRKRKRIVCTVMTVFLCLVCASVFVVILTLTHSSGQSQQSSSKKIYTYTRETPVHYNVRQENERMMKEAMDRARFDFPKRQHLISENQGSGAGEIIQAEELKQISNDEPNILHKAFTKLLTYFKATTIREFQDTTTAALTANAVNTTTITTTIARTQATSSASTTLTATIIAKTKTKTTTSTNGNNNNNNNSNKYGKTNITTKTTLVTVTARAAVTAQAAVAAEAVEAAVVTAVAITDMPLH
ncbi:uncharacterized protein LOC119674171 [Teleopsis dalmanni]|uniref:uncharacterized protein LOC119674171 n=1 Tax=Teleopsis dalmanni TaxID=139649 RepID=UPI0018CD99E3|nr:uncharacterized protein LOC119674171 [Teleopsis dalmanni]